MSYFTAMKLMTYLPEEALVIAINDAVGLSLNPKYVSIGEVQPAEDGRVRVTVTASRELPNSQEKRFLNGGSVLLDRKDIAEFFDGGFAIVYDGVISSNDVVKTIQTKTGIRFDERDFLETVISADSPRLVVSPRSLRWVGELPIANR